VAVRSKPSGSSSINAEVAATLDRLSEAKAAHEATVAHARREALRELFAPTREALPAVEIAVERTQYFDEERWASRLTNAVASFSEGATIEEYERFHRLADEARAALHQRTSTTRIESLVTALGVMASETTEAIEGRAEAHALAQRRRGELEAVLPDDDGIWHQLDTEISLAEEAGQIRRLHSLEAEIEAFAGRRQIEMDENDREFVLRELTSVLEDAG